MRRGYISAMSALSLVALLACGAPAPARPAPGPRRSDVHVDRRVELISIVMRLAGNAEYNSAPATPYVAEVDAWFGKYREHPVIAATRALAAQHDIGYDAPMALAIHLDAAFVPHDLADLGVVSDRWASVDVEAYAAGLRDFAREAHFDEFFAAHRDYYAKVDESLRAAVDAEEPVSWFEARFGSTRTRFMIIPGLLAGTWNYGVRANRPDGTLDAAQVLGVWQADGMPATDEDTIGTLVHEMAHSYINPIFDRHQAEFEAAGKVLFPRVARRLHKQGYESWSVVMDESGVRATVIQFFRDRKGAEAGAEKARRQQRAGFPWAPELTEVMARIPNGQLEGHLSEVARFFEEYAARPAADARRAGFIGPIDEALFGDPVFVAPLDREGARLVGGLRDSIDVNAPVIPTGADVLAANPGKDLVLYGAASDPLIASVLAREHWVVEAQGITVGGKHFDGPHLVLFACRARPDDPTHGIVVFTSYDAHDIGDLALWYGNTDWWVVRRTAQGYDIVDGANF